MLKNLRDLAKDYIYGAANVPVSFLFSKIGITRKSFKFFTKKLFSMGSVLTALCRRETAVATSVHIGNSIGEKFTELSTPKRHRNERLRESGRRPESLPKHSMDS